MIRFYFLPIVVTDNMRHAKYISMDDGADGGLVIGRWGLMDYGLINVALFAADVTQEQHDFLAAQSDVLAADANLDANLPAGAVPTIAAFFEDKLIPADWINSSYTYREGMRIIGGLFQFAQRFNGLHGEPLLTAQADLNKRPNQWAVGYENNLIATAQSFGYATDWAGNWQLRLVLKYLADQWGDAPLYIMGQSI